MMDNYATRKKLEVREWLADNPRITVHFTPSSASWMNLVQVWFVIIECQAIHRGTFRNVRDLTARIRAFINGWNPRAQPFVWTETASRSSRKPTAQQLQTRTTRSPFLPVATL